MVEFIRIFELPFRDSILRKEIAMNLFTIFRLSRPWYIPSRVEKKFVKIADQLVGFDENLVRRENEEIERQKKQQEQ